MPPPSNTDFVEPMSPTFIQLQACEGYDVGDFKETILNLNSIISAQDHKIYDFSHNLIHENKTLIRIIGDRSFVIDEPINVFKERLGLRNTAAPEPQRVLTL